MGCEQLVGGVVCRGVRMQVWFASVCMHHMGIHPAHLALIRQHAICRHKRVKGISVSPLVWVCPGSEGPEGSLDLQQRLYVKGESRFGDSTLIAEARELLAGCCRA